MASASTTDSMARPAPASPPSTAASADSLTVGSSNNRLARARRRETVLRVVLPVTVVTLLFLVWEAMVRINNIPHYILPAPSVILTTLLNNWDSLSPALWFTVKLTLLALGAAIAGGVLLAIAFSMSKWVEIGLFPIAVILQVTPIVAIAPLILIYVSSTTAALPR